MQEPKSSAQHGLQQGVPPLAADAAAAERVEAALALHLVLHELALVALPVHQHQLARPVPLPAPHLALVHDPHALHLRHVRVVERPGDRRRVAVVKHAPALELVVPPLAPVCDGAVGVSERAEAVHLVVLPLSVVVAALGVVELASAIAPSVLLQTLVLGADLVLLHHVLAFRHVGVVLLHFRNDRHC